MRLLRRQPTLADGFTLIELLIVMSLIVVLSSVALVGYQNSVIRAREAVLMDDLHKLREAIDQYYADKQKWPSTLQDLVTDGYVRKIPDDPMTNSADTWQTVPAEADPANPTAEAGIFDVKSGSDKTSLDGTPYADW
ncbi:MAG: type II secretion system protein [Acidobacteria bacterium]|nr:type II secretion system protein [Acidobacteriota bacterium]